MAQRIAILGFGREGQAALKFLKRAKAYAGAELWVLDKNADAHIPRGTKSILGPRHMENLGLFDIIIRSPGIPYMHPALVAARRKGVRCGSATELFFEYLASNVNGQLLNVRVIGITGTKGKGTTSTLLYNILRAAGKHVFLAGNIGTPALEILPRLKKNSVVILELSSFQLQGLAYSPHIALVLGVFPDHLESIKTAKHGTHLSLGEYYTAKASIAKHQTRKDVVFYVPSNKVSVAIAKKSKGKRIAVRAGSIAFLAPSDMRIPGKHNFLNAVAAASIARRLGVPQKKILKTVRAFEGNEHRLELARRIDNVVFYNDSASTNPHTSAAAVRAFAGKPHILIAGGHDKKLDYAPLAKAVRESKTKLVVLCGENKQKIAKAIRIRNYELGIMVVKNLQQAVAAAYKFARKSMIHDSSFVILFSPGAASFDMFRNYADRGEQFKHIVKNLQK